MFSKENIKTGGMAAFISVITSVILWLATHFSGGDNKPKPEPLPSPDESIPIVVSKEVNCPPGTTVSIEPKFLGTIEWSVPPPYEKKMKVYPFSDKIIVNVIPGVAEPLYIAISGIHKNKENNYVPSSVVYVKINTGDVAPEPEPSPNPIPPPVLPDGKYKLAPFVYKTVISNVPVSLRKDASAEFKKNYEGVSSGIVAGAYDSYTGSTMIQAIIKDTTESNRKSLDSLKADSKTWEPVFVSLQDELWNRYQGKTLNTKDEFATAWKEISVGFGAAAK